MEIMPAIETRPNGKLFDNTGTSVYVDGVKVFSAKEPEDIKGFIGALRAAYINKAIRKFFKED